MNLNWGKKKLYLVITGGGTRAISHILENGGASKWLYAAFVPYDIGSIFDINKEACVASTATYLSKFYCMIMPKIDGYDNVCVACTASLYKEGQRHGRINQAYLSVCINNQVEKVKHLVYTSTNRLEQENQLANDIFQFCSENMQ